MTKYQSNHICTMDKEIVVGGKYQYWEEGYVCDVTVLADESDSESIGFKLHIDKILNWPGEEGETFSVWATREMIAYSGMWRIYPLGEYVLLDDLRTLLRKE